ncbi:unnamed protein product, partial [Didymodactylos carnosus]
MSSSFLSLTIKFFACLLFLLFYCELLIYYLVLLRCSWPQLSKLHQDFTIQTLDKNAKPLRVLFIADPHLLNKHDGYWFDKLRREWQMYRSYQSALFLFEPNLIFFLGDLIDEGRQATNDQWESYVKRFQLIFHHPPQTTVHVIVGNHDIGFHYTVTDGKLERFEKSFLDSPYLTLITYENVHFVLANSMAFEGDNCRMCARAEHDLSIIKEKLECLEQESSHCEKYKTLYHNRELIYTHPILLTHFPLYRLTDENCTSDNEDDLDPQRYTKQMKENYDVLSNDTTQR